MRARVLALAAALTTVATPAAGAPCGVTDPAGDTYWGPVPVAASAMDILAIDSTVGRTELVTVLRLPSTAHGVAPYDRVWRVAVRSNGLTFDYEYRVAAGPVGRRASSAIANGRPLSHALTVESKAIVWRVSSREVPFRGRPSTSVELTASTHEAAFTVDTAAGRARRDGRC